MSLLFRLFLGRQGSFPSLLSLVSFPSLPPSQLLRIQGSSTTDPLTLCMACFILEHNSSDWFLRCSDSICSPSPPMGAFSSSPKGKVHSPSPFSRQRRFLRMWDGYLCRRVIRWWSGRSGYGSMMSLPMSTMDYRRRCLGRTDLGLARWSLMGLLMVLGRQCLVQVCRGVGVGCGFYLGIVLLLAYSAYSSLRFLRRRRWRLSSSSRSACSRQKVKRPLSSGTSSWKSMLNIILLLQLESSNHQGAIFHYCEANHSAGCSSCRVNGNKMLESSSKAFSKSLRKLINKTNPEQRQLSLYFQPTAPSPLPPLPQTHTRLTRAHSQKLTHHHTEPATDLLPEYQVPLRRERQSSFSQRVDDIVSGLLQRGEARLGKVQKDLKGRTGRQGKFRNLRVVTEASQSRHGHKRSDAFQQMQTMLVGKELSRERLLRRKFLLDNPQVQKKVDTRWGQRKVTPSKEMLSYYPLVDLRQENQEHLLNLPARSEDYLRKMRQTALHKLMKQ